MYLTLFVLFFTFLCPPSKTTVAAEKSKPVAIVNSVSGTVEVLYSGKINWERCRPGISLALNDKIRTGKDGLAELIFEDGSKIKLLPRTTIVISQITKNIKRLKLTDGKIHSMIKKLPKNKQYEIDTARAVVTVRGTDFMTGFDKGKLEVSVFSGDVYLEFPDKEIRVRENQTYELLPDGTGNYLPLSKYDQRIHNEIKTAETRQDISNQVTMDMTREQVQNAAKEEIKLAEYQQGKTIIDVFGYRVRIEEYIVRPRDDQFKLVVLNDRKDRFDYFTWLVTFNKSLPADLTIATRYLDWSSGYTMPDYYLKSSEYGASNTIDKIEWAFKDGKIYEQTEYGKIWYYHKFGSFYFKIGTVKDGIKIEKEKIFWDGTNYYVDNRSKIYTDFYTMWNENIVSTPKGYAFKDGSYREDYYIIDDSGREATAEEFEKIYDTKNNVFVKDELTKWNFQSVFSSPDFNGPDKKIDIVVEPKIFIDAGIIR